MLAEIELGGGNTMNLERSKMISHIFIVKIDRESKDRSWFWPEEKEWSVIYRPCIVFILPRNTHLGLSHISPVDY